MEKERDELTVQSKSNFLITHGARTRKLIEHCEDYAMRISDGADSERSSSLRRYMMSISDKVMETVEELEKCLGNDR